MKKMLLAATLALICMPASAEVLGLSVGASAGASSIEYDGNSEYGFEYGINGAYQINDIFSVSAGVVQGSAEVDASGNTVKNDIDYTAFPLTLRGDLPLLIGSLYAKAGTNYYDVDRALSGINVNDTGWGIIGGAGVVLTLIPLVDFTLGYEYRDMGDVTSNAVIFGIGMGL
ncbi:porin family protein [Photobacterium lipolyticum]|uniref:Porin family protein n=2 Tax=Photobacterium lipolyticum TaxID=266810 RepID=A0A2T3MX07_9GAMM|nr:porin family protein [Photobacterium lipolyticum]